MGSARPIIIVAEDYTPSAVARLQAVGDTEVLSSSGRSLDDAIAKAHALLVRTYTQVDAALLKRARRLRVVGRAGVGVENIDLAAAAARKITVVHTPAASTRSVAEHTIGLLLAVQHRLISGDEAVRGNTFKSFRDQTTFTELGGLTLGVIGMGRIGTEVARIASTAFDMRVVYNDIRPVGPFDFPAELADKESLVAQSNVVSLHLPLTDATRQLVDDALLTYFQPGAILLNTARGAVVDCAALARHLHNGHLAGAGLDVFDVEPLPADHPLIEAPNTLLTPHVASRSHAALERMNDVVDDVVRVLNGEPASFPATAV